MLVSLPKKDKNKTKKGGKQRIFAILQSSHDLCIMTTTAEDHSYCGVGNKHVQWGILSDLINPCAHTGVANVINMKCSQQQLQQQQQANKRWVWSVCVCWQCVMWCVSAIFSVCSVSRHSCFYLQDSLYCFVCWPCLPRRQEGYCVQIHYRVQQLKGFWPLLGNNNNRFIFL